MVDFQVLRCSECQTFQVLQVTKSPKWKCKMCGLKQSLIKVYGRGTGADCRKHVQKLNTLRGGLDDLKEQASLFTSKSSHSHSNRHGLDLDDPIKRQDVKATSQWTKFINEPDQNIDEETEASGHTSYLGFVQHSSVITDMKEFDAERRKPSGKRKMLFKDETYDCDHHAQNPSTYQKKHKYRQSQNVSMSNRKTNPYSSISTSPFHPVNPTICHQSTFQNTAKHGLVDNYEDCNSHNFHFKERHLGDLKSSNNHSADLNKKSLISSNKFHQYQLLTSKVDKNTSNSGSGLLPNSTMEKASSTSSSTTSTNNCLISVKKCVFMSKPSNSKWSSFLEDNENDDENDDYEEDGKDLFFLNSSLL